MLSNNLYSTADAHAHNPGLCMNRLRCLVLAEQWKHFRLRMPTYLGAWCRLSRGNTSPDCACALTQVPDAG